MNAVECLLKSENLSVAAKLDPLSPDAPVWLELAAAWRIRAIEERHGFAQEHRVLMERRGEVELWHSIVAPRVVRMDAARASRSKRSS
jgi:hypothetical protein